MIPMRHYVVFDFYNGIFYDFIARGILDAERVAEETLGNCCMQAMAPGDDHIDLLCGVWGINQNNTKRAA